MPDSWAQLLNRWAAVFSWPGQIFNLEEHWPGGVMLWALGAAGAWALLRSWPQMALSAILLPAWLVGEWIVATQTRFLASDDRPIAVGIFLLALTYFTAARADRHDLNRSVLGVKKDGQLTPLALN
jgi:hypothetical protein